MLCQNCGKNEASVKYTQIINGTKKEVRLCEQCAKKFGINSFEFNMPINFSNFLGDFFENYATEVLPSFIEEEHKCKNCGYTYDEFIKTGLFGCPSCYDTFSDKLDPILQKLQGSAKHIGRGFEKSKSVKTGNAKLKVENEKTTERIKKTTKLDELNEDLKKAIKDERYEDAAKIRDEIKKINK